MTGDGFRFAAPTGWTVRQTDSRLSASRGGVALVEVQRFRLVRPYRSTLFTAAARELDRVTAEIARELHGQVAAGTTVQVAGMAARSYRVAYGKLVEEITFLLDERREYELLCRRAATAGEGLCARFLSSFALTG